MNGLALYSGYGGIELGLKLAVRGYRTVCYVERELPVAARLVELMGQKALDEAPVWSDARTFDGKAWRGKVDIITAGFPCQPFSVAGKRKGIEDDRWEWPSVRRIIDEVRPEFVFLENVPGIITSGAVGIVTADLAARGYRWTYGILSAYDCGANHLRKRWWCLAEDTRRVLSVPTCEFGRGQCEQLEGEETRVEPGGSGQTVADPTCEREEPAQQPGQRGKSEQSGEDVPVPVGVRQPQSEGIVENVGRRSGNLCEKIPHANEIGRERAGEARAGRDGLKNCGVVSDTASEGLEGEESTGFIRERGQGLSAERGWWSVEPDVGRVADGVTDRVDRLRMLGNGVVPIVAAVAFSILYERLRGQ